jgi:hypothetical protein
VALNERKSAFHTVLGVPEWRYALILTYRDGVNEDEVDGEVERLRALAGELVNLDDDPDVLAALEDGESESACKDIRADSRAADLLKRRRRC